MTIDKLYTLFLRSQSVSTDSRNVAIKSIFFALKGSNFNGNEFAKDAIKSGALFAIVDQKEYEDEEQDIYYVEDTLNALQKLALYHREKLNIPIIALTGSNGKTTSKELITTVLSQKYKVASTFGNLNNHIGVPLTLLSIQSDDEIAVVEMGANHQMEIDFLSKIAKPDYGYITNFGKAHLEGFGSLEGIIKGKSELYEFLRENQKTAFVNSDDSKQMELTEDLNRVTFGSSLDSNFPFKFINTKSGNCSEINFGDNSIQSQLVGQYNAHNVAAAIAIGLHFEVPIENIKTAIEQYKSENNRSQIISKTNYEIILDAYNANPSSMEAALQNFSCIEGDKLIILGDMFELGETSLQEHKNIVDIAASLGFSNIILIGKNFYEAAQLSNGNAQTFYSREDAMEFLKNNSPSERHILIKGSRAMALENLIEVFS